MALSSSLVSLGTFVAIYAILALGLNLKFGFSGLLDIGHVTFYLVGAYVTALLVLGPAEDAQFASYILGLGWSWPAAIAVAVVLAGVVGMLVALPAIRLREDYLAISVLGFSEIARRVIQTQGWLANGPGALRGYGGPLRGSFPLPGGGVESAVIFGGVVFVFWASAAYLLSEVGIVRDTRSRLIHGLVAFTTIGAGYLAARLADERDSGLYPVAAGALVGAAAAGVSLAAPALAVLVFLGGLSLFTWVLGVAVVRNHYAGMSRRDVLFGLGLAIAFVGAFVPLILLGGNDSLLSTVGLLVTVVALVAFLYGLFRLADGWDRYDTTAPFVSVVGIGALWLFAIRYFLLALVVPFKNDGVAGASSELIQNVLWLVKASGGTVEFDYARFVFVITLAAVGVVYVLMERTVNSPFGRVLKAIREDEDVATALGKNTFSFKIQGMILGSAIAGLAGALWALSVGALVHRMFAPRVTFIVLLMVIIGGVANNRGAILGAVIFWAFQKGTTDIAAFFPPAARSSIQALRLAFIGALLIVILYYRPEGIWEEEKVTSPAIDAESLTADAPDSADVEASD